MRIWTHANEIPDDLRNAIQARLSNLSQLDPEDWQRLERIVGLGIKSVHEIFRIERIRWATRHAIQSFPQYPKTQIFHAVGLCSDLSWEHIRGIYYAQEGGHD